MSSLAGQSIIGDWDGTLQVTGFSLEMSISIIDGEDGIEGTLDIPAQNVDDMEMADVTLQGTDLYFALPKVPGKATYSGVLNATQDTISGSFTQAGKSIPLNFIKASEADFERVTDALERLAALTDSLMQEKQVPGVAIGIIKNDKIIMNQGFGYRDYERQKPVDKNTLFAIGSSTKAFVAAGLAILADENTVEWDAPVKTYLPDFQMHDEFASNEMTPLDLLTHRSGLPRHDLIWYGSPFSRQELYSKIKDLPSTEAFRTKFQYQNLMYMTAGMLIGKMSESSWEEFTAEEIFRPLKMTQSNFSVNASQKTNNYALPYQIKNEEIVQMDFRNIDNVGPAGSINSNTTDMLKWVKLQLNKGKYGSDQVISAKQFDIMHEPQMIVGKGPLANVNPEFTPMMYGTGWFIRHYDGTKIVQHGGNIDGFSAYVYLLPEDDIGMVILTNKNGAQLPTALAMHATDWLLGKKEIDWTQRIYQAQEKQDEDLKEERPSVKNTSPSHPISDYAGKYEHPAYGIVDVKQRSGKLQMNFNPFEEDLKHFHFDVFEANLSDLDQKIKLQFNMDQNGNIVSLSMTVEPMLGPSLFKKMPPKQIDDREFVTRVVGSYTLGEQEIKIRKEHSELKLSVPGQPEYTLEAFQKDEFNLKGMPGYSVKFNFNDSRRKVKELVFYQPNGTFRAKASE